ncbi:MAG TPA: helix-turn-helix domain-containing protein [Chloroflexota bacterium]|nr:helix-turn-helix domain-containing protein [Chloroflexota bacterium]
MVQRLKAKRADGVLIAAPFVSRRVRDVLMESNAGYADATGNLRLALDTPPLFIELSGAESNPWRETDQPLRTLKGPGAGRVVRALCELRPPYGLRELAKRCGAPASTASRVVALLDRDALLTRSSTGRIESVEWPALIRRWTQDYSLMRSNRTRMYIEPRGLPALLAKLRDTKSPYAVSASLAAVRRAPIAAPRLAVVYVPDVVRSAERLQIKSLETGANVLLAEPFDRVVFERTWQEDGVTYAGLAQVAADLLTSPGRAPSEGEELIRWMEANEGAWRS